jgi:hypothetical protein
LFAGPGSAERPSPTPNSLGPDAPLDLLSGEAPREVPCDPHLAELRARLCSTEPDQLTPRAALELLYELRALALSAARGPQ